MTRPEIESGLCQCGCGQKTRIAPVNDASKGWVKGAPVRFIKGHFLKNSGKGEKALRWNGGRSVSTHGYVVITDPEVGGRQYEHILLAEKTLGRPLRFYGVGDPRNEVVHHFNGNKQDNRTKNLLVCTHKYHMELHHRLEQSPEWPEFQKVIRNDRRRHEQAIQG